MGERDNDRALREQAYRHKHGHVNRKLIVGAFLNQLIAQDEILDPQIFILLDQEARKLGYQLCARNHGVQGTSLYFEPLE